MLDNIRHLVRSEQRSCSASTRPQSTNCCYRERQGHRPARWLANRYSTPLVLAGALSLACIGAVITSVPPVAAAIPPSVVASTRSHYSAEHDCVDGGGVGNYGWCWYRRGSGPTKSAIGQDSHKG